MCLEYSGIPLIPLKKKYTSWGPFWYFSFWSINLDTSQQAYVKSNVYPPNLSLFTLKQRIIWACFYLVKSSFFLVYVLFFSRCVLFIILQSQESHTCNWLGLILILSFISKSSSKRRNVIWNGCINFFWGCVGKVNTTAEEQSWDG